MFMLQQKTYMALICGGAVIIFLSVILFGYQLQQVICYEYIQQEQPTV